MLEEFSAAKIDSKKPAAPSGPGRPTTAPGAKDEDASLQDVLTDDDFAKQLTSGMAELLGEIQNTPQMQTQFEAMFKEIAAAADTEAGLDAAAVPVAASSSPKPAAAKPEDIAATEAAEASFQETIKRTMERMRASGDQATASAAAEAEAEGGPDDLLADLLKHMQSSGLDGLEGGGEEEFSKMLMGMMEQLTNKDILYEPMKELDEKFPAWLERNKGTTSEEDLKRYEEQHGIAKEIVAKFEETTYKDSNPKDRETIVNLMQKVSAEDHVLVQETCHC